MIQQCQDKNIKELTVLLHVIQQCQDKNIKELTVLLHVIQQCQDKNIKELIVWIYDATSLGAARKYLGHRRDDDGEKGGRK